MNISRGRHACRALFVMLALLFSVVAHAADWALQVTRIEISGALADKATLQITLPGSATAERREVKIRESFPVGTTLAIPARTSLVLKSSNGNELRLLPGSRIRITAGGDMGEEYTQEEGESFFDVKRALNFFNVRHRNFQAIVKGTRYSVKVDPKKEITFAVEEGVVKVEREGTLRVDESKAEGQISSVALLKAGEQKSYRLDIDEYLARFKHFGEAEAYYRENLMADRQSEEPERIQAGLNQLGWALLMLSRYQEAIPCFDEALRMARQRYPGGLHADIANGLNGLGDAYRNLGGTENLRHAIDYYEQGLGINRQLYTGGLHTEIARSLNSLGRSYNILGGTENLKRSTMYYEESLKINRQLYPGKPYAGIAWSLNNLGLVLSDLGGQQNLLHAIRLHEESLDIRRRLYSGSAHAEVAGSQNNLGIAHRVLGGESNLLKAIEYYEASLRIKRQIYPDGVHSGIGASLANLGLAYQGLGGIENLQQAINFHTESLSIRRQLYADGLHADIAGSLNNLGRTYAAIGGRDNTLRAIGYFESSLELLRKLYPVAPNDGIAWRLNNLGMAYFDLGGVENLRRALQYHAESLNIRRQLYPDLDRADVAGSLANLANVRLYLGQEADALSEAREALQIEPQNLAVHAIEAHALLLLGQEDEALAIYTKYRDEKTHARQSFRNLVLDDFTALRRAGVGNPGMARVEALYALSTAVVAGRQ